MQSSLFDREHLFISLAGEGFEEVCNPRIKVEFDDDGNIEISFYADEADLKKEDVIWVELLNFEGFKWQTIGEVDNIILDDLEDEGYSVSGLTEEDEWVIEAVYRIKVRNKSTIRVKLQTPIYRTKYLTRINTPTVCSLTMSSDNHEEKMNSLVDLLDSGVITEENEQEYVREILNSIFSVGRLGNTVFSPAYPRIDVIYRNTDMRFRNYDLRAKPDQYSNEDYGLLWEGWFQQLYPIVEYRNNRAIEASGRAIWLLYLLGTFLVSTGAIELIGEIGRRVVKRTGSV